MDNGKEERLYPIRSRSKNELHYPHNFNHPGGLSNHKKEKGEIKQREKAPHTHAYLGTTSTQNGHAHQHLGVTSTPIETSKGHVHNFYNRTTFDDNHIHYYEGTTGPPIQLPNGFHTHYIEITTNENNGHTHIIKGFTEHSNMN